MRNYNKIKIENFYFAKVLGLLIANSMVISTVLINLSNFAPARASMRIKCSSEANLLHFLRFLAISGRG